MLTPRIVVCLDVADGRVVKGVQFEGLRDVGDPVELATRYEAEGADEIVLLDISASPRGRATLLDVVRATAERLFIPLTVGGGVRSVDDMERVLRAGADKVSVGSAAIARPEMLTDCAARFGAQCVVISVDAREEDPGSGVLVAGKAGGGGSVVVGGAPRWHVYSHGGRYPTGLDAVDWSRRAVQLGAGEILLTSIDRDGARSGYDLRLTKAVGNAVSVPVVASGGAGSPDDVAEVLTAGGADAALVAGILHDGLTTVREIKRAVERAGLHTRAVA